MPSSSSTTAPNRPVPWSADAVHHGSAVGVGDQHWNQIQSEAVSACERDPSLNRLLKSVISESHGLEAALSRLLARKLATEWIGVESLEVEFTEVFATSAASGMRRDLQAIRDRDPVARGFLAPFLFFKGFHALQAHRLSHWLWNRNRELLAVHLQSRISEVFGVDVHPAARLGSGILMDHATGIVIGETCVIEDNVSLLHEVTLGGTGKETGDRHPKVRAGVLIGAGAKLLGNIEVGADAKVGAGSVVLDSVPPRCTVAGVPARIVARAGGHMPAFDMDQVFPHSFEDGSGI